MKVDWLDSRIGREQMHDRAPYPALVLVVEDDRIGGKLLKVFFEELGYTVTLVVDAIECQAAIASGATPRVVVLDLLLPGLSGVELARWLRTQPATTEVPIVVVSSLDRAVGVRALGTVAFAAYVQKPVDLVELSRCVAACCEGAPP